MIGIVGGSVWPLASAILLLSEPLTFFLERFFFFFFTSALISSTREDSYECDHLINKSVNNNLQQLLRYPFRLYRCLAFYCLAIQLPPESPGRSRFDHQDQLQEA